MIHPRPIALALLAAAASVAAASVAGCAPSGRSRPSAATTAACRAETDRVYAAQNRVDLSTRDQRDAPFADSYLPGITSRGLGARFGRDNLEASCLNNAGNPTAADGQPGPTFSPSARGGSTTGVAP